MPGDYFTSKIALCDGKTGVFKNEIFEMKKAGKLDAATKAPLKKETSFPVKLAPGKWYPAIFELWEGESSNICINLALPDRIFYFCILN